MCGFERGRELWKTACVTDAWDERTEAIPGTKDDKSFELDFDFSDGSRELAALERASETHLGRLSVVVFEPSPFGLSDALMRMGFRVRVGKTGVDVMSVVAVDPPGAVICAPAPDAERRRLLAAALRLRFPQVPIIYVSTHSAQEDAVLGALREGARAVLGWPLPSAAEVVRVLEPFLNPPWEAQLDTAPTPKPPLDLSDAARALDPREELHEAPTGIGVGSPARMGPGSSEDARFDVGATIVTGEGPRRVTLHVKPKPTGPAFAEEAGPDDPTTQPNLRPAAIAAAEALAQHRGELGDLLAAVSPFLWSLEDASRWAAERGAQGDVTAANHARTLMLLAKILGQLQARIDDMGA